MQQLSFDFLPERRYQRRPFETHDIRTVRELYLRQGMTSREVARIMGRPHLSLKQFIKRHPELQKGRKGE